MCVSACTTTTAGVAFFLTGNTLGSNIATTGIAPPVANVPVIPGCFYDYLGFPGGQVQAFPFTASDRYCGSALGLSVAGGATVCSMFGIFRFDECFITLNFIVGKVKPFKMTYGTDGLEPTVPVIVAVPPPDLTGVQVLPTSAVPVSYVVDTANTGFCLDYQEK
jgi:hypothetical protein